MLSILSKYFLESILKSGYKEGSDVLLSLDVASNEIYKNNKYNLLGENKSFDSDQMCIYLSELVKKYPIFSIEDGIKELINIFSYSMEKITNNY